MSGSRGKVFPGDQLLVSLVQFISSISYYFNLLDFISSALVHLEVAYYFVTTVIEVLVHD